MTRALHAFRAFHGITLLLGLLVLALGASVLLGWAFDIAALKSVFPNLETMKANTALGMVLGGGGLALLSGQKITRPIRFWTTGMAVVVIALGALTLSEGLFGSELGIDQWLFRDMLSPENTLSPGRASPSTAFCFMLAGSALLTASQPLRTRWRLPALAAFGAAVMIFGGLALAGYASDALLHVHMWNYSGIAVHTAAGFLLLGYGLLTLVLNESGPTWLFSTPATVGFLVGIVSLLMATSLAYNFTNQLFEGTKWVSHTHEVLKEIEKVRTGMAELESSQRGYILMGDEHLLEPRTEIKDAIQKDLDTLRYLTIDNSHQQSRLDGLMPLIVSRTRFGEQTILARRQKGLSAAQQMIATGTGIQLTESIAHRLKEMSDEEYALLIKRQKISGVASARTFLFLPLGVYLGMTLLLLAIFFLNADVTERKRAEEAQRASEARLNFALQTSQIGAWELSLGDHTAHRTLIHARIFGYETLLPHWTYEMFLEHVLPEDRAEVDRKFREAMAAGANWNFECRIRRTDGQVRWIWASGGPERDAEGKAVRMSGIVQDITERKQNEEARRASEARYRTLFEYAPDGIVIADPESYHLDANASVCRMLGYTHDELIRLHASDIVAQAEIQQIGLAISEIKTKSNYQREWQLRRKDGSLFGAEVIATLMPDGNMLGMIRDVTERKLAEEALHRQAYLIDQAYEPILAWDLHGAITFWNRGAEQLYGFPREEAIGQVSHDLLHTTGADVIVRALEADGKWEGEVKHSTRDGREIIVESRMVLVRDAQGARVLEANRDVTERKRAEEALRESEERFQAMANGIPQLAHMAGADGGISWYNQRWYEYTGTTPEQMEGWGWQSVIDPAMLPKVMKRWQASIVTGEPFNMEFPLRGGDGTFRTFLNRVMPLKDSKGRVVRWFGTNTDISEHKEAQELLVAQAQELSVSRDALEAQTRMFKLVLDSMGEGLIAADRDGHFLIWNDSAKQLMGRDASDLPTEQWTPYYQVFLSDGITPCPPDRLPLVRALHGESVQVEMMVQQPGRAEGVFLEVSARPLKDGHGNLGGGVAVLHDITERKAAERQIQTLNQSLEARVIERTAELKAANKELEAFSYSVSHDLRAPLRAVDGFSQAVLEDYSPLLPEEGRRNLQTIREGAQRMGTLIDDLLTFSRLSRAPLKKHEVNTDRLIRSVIEELNSQREGRQIEIRIGDLPACQGDPGLLKQVWVNLISNALKYTRRLETAVIEIGCKLEQGETVYFVRDNGAGFDMQYAHKLFGVFQRLHRADEFDGTGVGLAIVQRVVQRHGGRIWADAAVGRGATFCFTLNGRTNL